MSKFKVGDEVEVIQNTTGGHREGTKGKISNVDSSCPEGMPYYVFSKDEGFWHRESDLKIIKPKLSKNQRIAALEDTVAKQGEEIEELKVIVHQLRKPSTEVTEALAIDFEADADVIEFEGAKYKKVDREAREGDVVVHYGSTHPYMTDDKPYKLHFNAKANTLCYYADSGSEYPLNREYVKGYDVYEEIKQDVQRQTVPCDKAKTANELRAEVIEKAKLFVEEHSKGTDIVVNDEYQAVTAIYYDGKNVHKESALCHPNDVYNEHTGKAIAVGRVKKLDVSEFEQAVQPNEVVIGHKLSNEINDEIHEVTSIVGIEMRTDGTELYWRKGALEEGVIKIINDTNAQYTIPTGPTPVAER